MRYYLAGGAVRDMLLGRSPHEFDIVFEGAVEGFLRYHPGAVRVGKAAAVYIVDGHDHMPLAGTIHEDLLARDLTINALLLAEDGTLHALPQTFADLKGGCLRHVAPSSFPADPVRVFRTARFYSTLPGFSIAPETLVHMRDTAALPAFRTLAAERVGNEVMRALAGHTPGNFLRAQASADCLVPWFSPLEAARHVPAGPPRHHGTNSAFEHTCAVMDAIAAMPYSAALPEGERALAVWMGLCHDLGKTVTPREGHPRHIGHDALGSDVATALATSLRLPARWIKAASLAAGLHMKGGRYHSLRAGTRVDLLHHLAKAAMAAPFCALIMADSHDATLGGALEQDMAVFHAVHLPEEWQNRGAESAVKLRELRAQAIALANRALPQTLPGKN